ncbi:MULTISPECIES: hypothetical protein [unclassified Microbacterium]|uniref:hypothetical protein n=1 Tax=unclassified Microbacterium TaxID=2609290 RepID=UPI000CFC7C7C|nr:MULTISPECIES: hypothetical protein [unclassified Microbacterium]PQZ53526.1 hypothetical protein CQ032_15315 [Microbacterium sp. MYb43]PQZ75128.1 hypothetical protein CQ031_14665 [Microbacterium sp. MYb40]PRB19423.1 hypothetical protein CQ040_15965 [Microbacterium sp. MYb54]PRB24624.1 hypothetical protein CQ037_16470 [Microbacterium sp. MYb50]PRB63735.1 hypothetical protein CQ021_16075 [Microbacterium sp. MYb24]
MRRATLTHTYQSPTGSPLQLRRGDTVHVGSADHPRPGFEFVLTADGHGWVPTRHLTNDRPAAVIRFAYDTTELDATIGDRITVIVDDPHVGQSWCRTPDGREGWLPRDILG